MTWTRWWCGQTSSWCLLFYRGSATSWFCSSSHYPYSTGQYPSVCLSNCLCTDGIATPNTDSRWSWHDFGGKFVRNKLSKDCTTLPEVHSNQQWCSQGGGGHWRMSPPPVVVRVKFFKSSRFGSVTTGYDTLLKFWSAWFTAWVWTACGDMIVQCNIECLTSFFVFNTVLCFLICSLSVCLSTEEVSVTVLVFLVLYIFAYFLR